VPPKFIAEDGSDDVTVRTLAQAVGVSYETTSIADHVQSEVARLFPATLGVPMQHMHRDVRPNLTESIRRRIAQDGVTIFRGQSSRGTG
jgi:hypothetical protein